MLTGKTRLIAVTHVSNALGTVNPISRMTQMARRRGIPVLVDGAQAVPHMAESRVAHYHSDSIITTIYEGTSEIQASFALKEMSKGALFATLDATRGELAGISAAFPDLAALVSGGIDDIQQSIPALMGDAQYALLNAKRICEMVIDVVVSSEFLLQAGFSEQRHALATAFIHRRMATCVASGGRWSSAVPRCATFARTCSLRSSTMR